LNRCVMNNEPALRIAFSNYLGMDERNGWEGIKRCEEFSGGQRVQD
jgi:hypothetical protein